VRRVAGQKQASELHGLDDKAAHGRDVLLENGPFLQRPAVAPLEPFVQLAPDPIVRPVLDAIVVPALNV
jgi:hypothetical protein